MCSGLRVLGHQVILSLGGVQSWVMSDRREGLIGMNKEGIVSFTGASKDISLDGISRYL